MASIDSVIAELIEKISMKSVDAVYARWRKAAVILPSSETLGSTRQGGVREGRQYDTICGNWRREGHCHTGQEERTGDNPCSYEQDSTWKDQALFRRHAEGR